MCIRCLKLKVLTGWPAHLSSDRVLFSVSVQLLVVFCRCSLRRSFCTYWRHLVAALNTSGWSSRHWLASVQVCTAHSCCGSLRLAPFSPLLNTESLVMCYWLCVCPLQMHSALWTFMSIMTVISAWPTSLRDWSVTCPRLHREDTPSNWVSHFVIWNMAITGRGPNLF